MSQREETTSEGLCRIHWRSLENEDVGQHDELIPLDQGLSDVEGLNRACAGKKHFWVEAQSVPEALEHDHVARDSRRLEGN